MCIIGKQVGAGYINKNKGGYYKERGNNAYKTGDIAFYDENWEIHIIGRKDNQIRSVSHYRSENLLYVFQPEVQNEDKNTPMDTTKQGSSRTQIQTAA